MVDCLGSGLNHKSRADLADMIYCTSCSSHQFDIDR